MLIDFEYGGWNPQTYDFASYLNEHVCDNGHPEGSGIKYYPQNTPSEASIEFFVKCYYKETMAGKSEEEIELSWQENKDRWIESTKKCQVLEYFYWTGWTFVMMKEADFANPDYYAWEFL